MSIRPHLALARGYPLRAFWICFTAYALSQMDLALFGYVLGGIRAEFQIDLIGNAAGGHEVRFVQ